MNYAAVSEFSNQKENPSISPAISPSIALFEIAQKCDGFSGRSLRKLPFIAFSLCHSPVGF